MGVKGQDLYEKIVELAKRRGFFWPSYEIYGGVAGFYDLGPLGTLLKKRIEEKWREWFIKKHQEYIVEIETPVIAPEKVFIASGHVESFTDPIVECIKCHRIFRADHLIEESLGISVEGYSPEELTKIITVKDIKCPICKGPLSKVKLFNLLFRTTIGPYRESVGYLRPEAAQGMFTAFKRVYEVMRAKLPLGIAQIGRVARNEISPRQGMIRLREFTIMEFEFFFDPDDPLCPLLNKVANTKLRILTCEARERGEEKPEEFTVEEAVKEKIIVMPWLAYWMAIARDFVHDLGVPYDKMFFIEKLPHERAHYAKQTFDQLVEVSRWGYVEVSGHAYRTDYDLSRHMKYSGQDLRVFKPFEKPIIVRKKKIDINRSRIGKDYGKKFYEIIKYINELNVDEIEKALQNKGYIELPEGIKLTKEHISVIEVEEKITGKHFIPHVVEPSFGAERLLYIALEYAYKERENRIILSLPRDIAPIQVAVFPLLSKPEFIVKAKDVYKMLINAGFYVLYDESGSIGRRYARADEIGIPACITIDHQTLNDDTVTLRDRDTWKQVRIHISELISKLHDFIYRRKDISELGILIS